MKKKMCIICMVIVMMVSLAGCKFIIKKTEKGNLEKEEMNDGKKVKMEKEETEAMIERNAEFILSYIDISEDGAQGCIQKLFRVGCSDLEKVEITDTERCYSLRLTDIKGKKYDITLSYEGYLGVIKDENGDYLYAPVD